jgi:hypothetical protein
MRRALARASREAEPPPDAVHCALLLAEGGGRELAALVAALRERASRPLHVWVLALPGTGRMERRLPGVTAGRVPVRGLRRVTRLVLAELLPDVARAVMLRPDAVVRGDVAELAGLDLGGHAFAAPRLPGVSCFGVIHRAATRLGDRTDAASELRRSAHARHRFDFDAFADNVLVLDLERMRRERFAAQALPLVQAFGLRELEALHYLAGPQRAAIPERFTFGV